MNDVMLPWPGPRRRDDGSRDAPHYEIQQVFDDGTSGPLEVVPITRPPWSAKAGRRGFLGAGIASSVVLSLLLTGCNNDNSSGNSGPSGTSPTDSGPTSNSDTTSNSNSNSGGSSPAPTSNSNSNSGGSSSNSGTGGGGGYYCSCNKVCTCIPVG